MAKGTQLRQKKAMQLVLEGNGSVSDAMRKAGYPESTSRNPQQLTRSKAWIELMEKHFSDTDLAQVHKELMNSTTLDHMTFPRAPEEGEFGEHILTDLDITEMLEEVNCKVRRIVHGENARHVYFWSADNKARKDALDMAYKLKAKYAPERTEHLYGFVIADEDRARIDAILGDSEN